MLSQQLLDEIIRLDNIVDNKNYDIEETEAEVKKGFQEYIKDTVTYNLGHNSVDMIL